MARFEGVELTLVGSCAFIAQFFERSHALQVAAPCHPERGDAPIEMRLLRVFLWRKLTWRLAINPFSKQLVSAL
jgi:hypothetical protein